MSENWIADLISDLDKKTQEKSLEIHQKRREAIADRRKKQKKNDKHNKRSRNG